MSDNALINKKVGMPLLAFLALFGVLSIVAYKQGTQQVIYDLDLKTEDYTGLFTHLLIVAIILERCIEVWNAIWRRAGREELELELKLLTDETERGKKQSKIDVYRARTRCLAMYLGFAAGLVVAFAGISTLGALFITSELGPYQAALFRAADIIFTAGLLAGGSKGLNETITAIREAIPKPKAQS